MTDKSPFDLQRLVLASPALKPQSKNLYFALRDFLGRKEHAFPKLNVLAKAVSLSRKSTTTYLRPLYEHGLVRRKRHRGASAYFLTEKAQMTPEQIARLGAKNATREVKKNEKRITKLHNPSAAAAAATEGAPAAPAEKSPEKRKAKVFEPTPEQVQLKAAWGQALKAAFPNYEPLPWSYVDAKGNAKLSDDGTHAQNLIAQLGVERAQSYVTKAVGSWSMLAQLKFPTLTSFPTLSALAKWVSELEPRVLGAPADVSADIKREMREFNEANPGMPLPTELRDRFLHVKKGAA